LFGRSNATSRNAAEGFRRRSRDRRERKMEYGGAVRRGSEDRSRYANAVEQRVWDCDRMIAAPASSSVADPETLIFRASLAPDVYRAFEIADTSNLYALAQAKRFTPTSNLMNGICRRSQRECSGQRTIATKSATTVTRQFGLWLRRFGGQTVCESSLKSMDNRTTARWQVLNLQRRRG